MLKLGILRSPSGSSLSEVMHTAALQHLNIKGEYKAYGVSPEELKKVFNELKVQGINGLNVTIPHKISIIPLLDEVTKTAELVGAVNTIIMKNGKSIGDNTDVIGFWEAIPRKIRKNIPNKTIAILGCGGAAHACVTALISNGVKKIKVFGRNHDKLKQFKNHFESINVEIDLIPNIDLSDTLMPVNTTPVGMHPNVNNSPLSKEELKKLPKDAFVYDIIYNPLQTKLLQDARSFGLQTLNGVEMLVRQGATSLNIWLGKEVAPVIVMRFAVVQELERGTSLRGA